MRIAYIFAFQTGFQFLCRYKLFPKMTSMATLTDAKSVCVAGKAEILLLWVLIFMKGQVIQIGRSTVPKLLALPKTLKAHTFFSCVQWFSDYWIWFKNEEGIVRFDEIISTGAKRWKRLRILWEYPRDTSIQGVCLHTDFSTKTPDHFQGGTWAKGSIASAQGCFFLALDNFADLDSSSPFLETILNNRHGD